MDNNGAVRIHDPSKTIQLKAECAGSYKKVARMNSFKDKLYFVSAHDRSVIVEVDLKSIDLKTKERRLKYGKIIDLLISQDDKHLITLNKDGVAEIRDLAKPDPIPIKVKKPAKKGTPKPGHEHDPNPDASGGEESPTAKHYKEDVIIDLAKCNHR